MSNQNKTALGESYYQKFEIGPLINDRLRRLTEKVVIPTVEFAHGRLDLWDSRSDLNAVVPEEFIGVVDHRSEWDIPYAAAALRQMSDRTAIVVMKEAYIGKWYTGLFHKLGAIGVGRGAGDGPLLLEEMEEFLKLGYNAWYFGEGTRVKSIDKHNNRHDTRKIAAIGTGATKLSLETGVPVRTLALAGLADDDSRNGRRTPVVAVAGDVISPSRFYDLDNPSIAMSEAVRHELQQNKNTAYQIWDNGVFSIAPKSKL